MLDKKFILPSTISFIGFLFLVSMDSVIKILGETYSVIQLLFLNALFSLIPLFFFIYKKHGFQFYKKQNYTFQFIRGIIHTIGFLFVLKGVLLLPLSVVYPVLFTSPLMLLVMSHFFLSDNINIVRVLAILIGFLGVVISAEPFGTNIVSILGVLFVFLLIHICYSCWDDLFKVLESADLELFRRLYAEIYSVGIGWQASTHLL